MSKTYDKNGVSFHYPACWQLVEEEQDDQISAITLEDGDGGIYMIDIYHYSEGPELLDYMHKHFRCFVDELPFFSRVIEGPHSGNVSNQGVDGVVFEFVVRSFLVSKTRYINSAYKFQALNSVSFLSSQYPKESDTKKEGFAQVLGSYKVQ